MKKHRRSWLLESALAASMRYDSIPDPRGARPLPLADLSTMTPKVC